MGNIPSLKPKFDCRLTESVKMWLDKCARGTFYDIPSDITQGFFQSCPSLETFKLECGDIQTQVW